MKDISVKVSRIFQSIIKGEAFTFSFKPMIAGFLLLLLIPTPYSIRLPATSELMGSNPTGTVSSVGQKQKIKIEVPQYQVPEIEPGQQFNFIWIGGGPILGGTISKVQQVGEFNFSPLRGSFFPKGSTARILGQFNSDVDLHFPLGSRGMVKVSLGTKPLIYVMFKSWIDTIWISTWELT